MDRLVATKCLLGAALLLLAANASHATSPRLSSIVPTCAQRGAELEVTFEGDRLGDARQIIACEPGLEILRLTEVTNKFVKAQLRISADCALGEHHLRLRTESGLSELGTFFVGTLPVVPEQEPNNDTSKAQKIALNCTVTGVITKEDVDCFAFDARRGQKISIEVEGMRLGRGLFDPRLILLDEHGSVVADIDDTWLGVQDPFLTLVAPQDGKFFIQLREAAYGGDDRCHYRLHVGEFPRPSSIFPLGGKAGETVTFKFASEAGGEFEQQIKLPDSPSERLGLFAEQGGLLAQTPNWIRVSAFPNVLESAPNHDRDHATKTDLQPPFALNGVISARGEEDWFEFQAQNGTALEAAVFARRLRSPLDSVLEVYDAKGQKLASDDDAAGADSSLTFTPSETTNYFVRIRDTLGQGGPEFAYRIEVVPVRPRLKVKIPEVSRNDTQSRQFIAVPRGNRCATLISAKRSNFDDELAFDAGELPPGVTLRANPMAPKVDSMPLVFEAGADAELGCRLLDLTATGSNANGIVKGAFRQEVEWVQGPPNNANYYSSSVDKFCVAVTREAPFHVRIVEPQVPLVQSGSMRLEIAAERAAGFEEPIKVEMLWNPPGISSQSEATIDKGATNVFYQLNAGGGAETRSWAIAVLAHATVEGGELYVSSQLANLEVATPFLTGKIETLWINPGKTAKLTVNLQQAKPFEGTAKIRLLGLPEKVTTSEKEITKDDTEVAFDLNVDAACQTGSHKNLFCAVDLKQNGQVIPHTIAAGGILRIVPPRKGAAAHVSRR